MSMTPAVTAGDDKPAAYESILAQLGGLLAGERDPWANSANAAALLFASLADLNWAGFYFLRGGELVVGPFQGKPACIRISLGRGVCGKAAADRRTLIVPDVHTFADHIACDAASNSEAVVPIVSDGRLVGVLDLDSPSFARFDEDDAAGLQRVAAMIAAGCDWQLAGIDHF
jgi:L-methionine (R)-S-oxide reductase